MKTLLITATLGMLVLLASAAWASAPAGPAPTAFIDIPHAGVVRNPSIVPDLPVAVVAHLPRVEAAGDRYLAERIALAELVSGERILAAEELANAYARDLPGFGAMLQADGFGQDPDGTWRYDYFSSWMRFLLKR